MRSLLVLLCCVFCVAGKPPIVLVPGDGGTQLWAKLNRTTAKHWLCEKQTKDYFLIWLNLEMLLTPVSFECGVDDMVLRYDPHTRKTSNQEGVDIRINDWGNTTTVEWLDSTQWSVGNYFADLVKEAVDTWGYRRGKDIRGAPFDFRKAPNEFDELYVKLKLLIEDTYYQNGNTRVVLVAHSMGNPVLMYFLNTMTQAWKDKFIQSFFSIAAPWGGAVKTLLVMASGYNLDHYRIVLPPSELRPFQRSMPSTPFMFPSAGFWNDSEILVTTATANYTVRDYRRFFADMKYPIGYEMYKDTHRYLENLVAPNVELFCAYGTGLATPESYQYPKGDFPDTQPYYKSGDGDGTVNVRSSTGCKRWQAHQSQRITMKEIKKGEHLSMLQSKELLQFMKTVVLKL